MLTHYFDGQFATLIVLSVDFIQMFSLFTVSLTTKSIIAPDPKTPVVDSEYPSTRTNKMSIDRYP